MPSSSSGRQLRQQQGRDTVRQRLWGKVFFLSFKTGKKGAPGVCPYASFLRTMERGGSLLRSHLHGAHLTTEQVLLWLKWLANFQSLLVHSNLEAHIQESAPANLPIYFTLNLNGVYMFLYTLTGRGVQNMYGPIYENQTIFLDRYLCDVCACFHL